MIEVFLEALTDSVKLLPFLFVTYLVMGLLEKMTSDKSRNLIKQAERIGPLWGSLIGVIPQCGFSAAASYFYIGRVITLGTLISIYMATSDEMLPILISEQVAPGVIVRILAAKVVIGMITGFVVELLFGWMVRHHKVPEGFEPGERSDCSCCTPGVLTDAVKRALKVCWFIFLISLVIGVCIDLVGKSTISSVFFSIPVLGEAVAGLVGLIPNCAASVVITQLYLDGIIGPGAMMSGLLVSAGVGLLVLFKENRRMKENLWITVLLYAASVLWGCVITVLGITF